MGNEYKRELEEYSGTWQDEGYASQLDQILEGYESEADSFLSEAEDFSR